MHIRSADTSTSVSNSRGELEKILDRYGCTRFGSDHDSLRGVVMVWFTVPDDQSGTAAKIPVRIEVKLEDVRVRLAEFLEKNPDPKQVERVAWRHIVFLVEAGLIAAAAGVKKVSEFFLADTLVPNERGLPTRFVAALEGHDPTWKGRLLPPGSSHVE